MSQAPPPGDGSDSTPPQKPLASWYAQGLSDGLGDRLLMFDNSSAPSLELLRLRPELSSAPGFEEALRERVQSLSRFRHPSFARVRAVEHLEPDEGLAVISNYTPGKRLSELLHQANGPRFAKALIRQLAPALALLQQQNAGLGHGALNLDRIVVTPEGRLTIVEHVLGAAIETLGLSASELAALGIAVPSSESDESAPLDLSTDMYQLGLVALSVLVGRPLSPDEHPRAEKLLEQFAEAAERDGVSFSPLLRRWLHRALQIGGERFQSLGEAQHALAELLLEDQTREPSRTGGLPHPVTSRVPSAVEDAVRTPQRITGTSREPVRDVADDVARARPAAGSPHPSERVFAPEFVGPAPQTDLNQPGSQFRTLFDYEPPTSARKPGSARAPQPIPQERVADRTTVRRAADRTAKRAAGRTRTFGPAVAALAMLSAGEAVVIAGLVYRQWFTPPQPIVVETNESGTDVVVEGRSTADSPLRLTVAPDMRWVRVVGSTPPAKALAARTGQRPLGGIQISSPIDLQIFENDRLLGSAPGARLDVEPGRHDIEIVNLALGYRLRQTVDVDAGQTVSLYVAPADGWVNLDAAPWAEAMVDGKPVGRTPIVNLPLTLGEHEFTFRHPQLGEDRQKVIVKSDAVIRVTANLRR
jgi:hypothetical protein